MKLIKNIIQVYTSLKEYSIYNPRDTGYTDYDFPNEIKNNIKGYLTEIKLKYRKCNEYN